MKSFALACTVLLSPILTLQTSLAEIIRNDSPGGIMQYFKIDDQQYGGTCYAHAAAQTYDAFRLKYSSPEKRIGFLRTSPEDLAIKIAIENYNKHNDNYEGGNITDALNYLSLNGGCNKDYTDQNKSYNTAVTKIIKDIALFNQQYTYDQIQELKVPINYAQNKLEITQNHYRELSMKVNFENHKTVDFEAKTVSAVKELLKVSGVTTQWDVIEKALLGNHNATAVMASLQKLGCPTNQKIAPSMKAELQTLEINTDTNEKTLKSILETEKTMFPILVSHFKKSREQSLPIMIGYCSAFLGLGSKANVPNMIKGLPIDCGAHASIITGIDTGNGTPESARVLIRNSYGNTCEWANANYECKNGSIWVPYQDLALNVLQWTLIKEF